MIDNSSQSSYLQKTYRNKAFGNVLSILSEIFDSLGQKQLLSLIKLRRLWFSEINNFLARNAFPRNISVLKQFTLNSDFLNQFDKQVSSPDFLNALEKMNGMSFNHFEQFHSHFKKQINRLINKEEKELLKNKVILKPTKTILHLTVYDGSISQALLFEKDAYLRIFNRLLPEIKLDEIHCHVGDMRQSQFDQIQVSSLAKDWHLLTPKEIHQKCMPAFIHRVSKKYAVLVLYVSNLEDLELLTNNNGEYLLVKHLQKKSVELQDVLRRVSFVIKPELDLEQIKLRSLIFGDISDFNPNSNREIISRPQTKISKKKLYAREQFAKIRKKIQTGS